MTENWCKVIFSNETYFLQLGTYRKSIARRRKGELHHEFCIVATVKHPETMWRCFSSNGVNSFTVLPQNTSLNKEWHHNLLEQELLPTTQEQFCNDLCISQHDGAP